MRGTKPTTVRKTTGWGINTADTDIVSADWARSPTGHGDAGYHALYVPVSPPSGHGNVSPPPGEAVTPLSRAGVNGSVFSYAVVRLIGVALHGWARMLTCVWLHHRTTHVQASPPRFTSGHSNPASPAISCVVGPATFCSRCRVRVYRLLFVEPLQACGQPQEVRVWRPCSRADTPEDTDHSATPSQRKVPKERWEAKHRCT